MNPKRISALVVLAAAAVSALFVASCNDSTKPATHKGTTILVPVDMTLEEAVAAAAPGDTLLLQGGFTTFDVSRTLEIASDQTPIVIRGGKDLPLITSSGTVALLRFRSPKAGTKVEAVSFTGAGSPALLEATGPGELTVSDCRFVAGAAIQLHGTGDGLHLVAAGNLMRDAGTFSIMMTGDSDLESAGNTIDNAGDCGLLLQNGVSAYLHNNIVNRSHNFGVACQLGAILADSSGCNDFFASANGDYMGTDPPAGDFHADPLFCGTGVFTIKDISPCAADNSGGCGPVGAFPVGCTASGAPARKTD